jgi:hypothetical protein
MLAWPKLVARLNNVLHRESLNAVTAVLDSDV